MVNLPEEVVHLEDAISDRSGATLRAPFTCPPQESSDVSAEGDTAETPDPQANVGISTNLPDLEVGAYANVGASTSVDNTPRTIGRGIGVGFSVGGASAPVASDVTPVSSDSRPTWRCGVLHE